MAQPLQQQQADLGLGRSQLPARELSIDRLAEPSQKLLALQTLGLFARAFARLGAKQTTILILRAGLDGNPPRTLREIGEKLGVSRERVRQIEAEARVQLRRWIGTSMRRPPGG